MARPLTLRIAEAVYRYDRAVRARRLSFSKCEARKARAQRQLEGVLGGRDLPALRAALAPETGEEAALIVAVNALRLVSDQSDVEARHGARLALMKVLPDAVTSARASLSVVSPDAPPPAWTKRLDIGD
jgi:hypothetical protein